jgi:hypothetical protein
MKGSVISALVGGVLVGALLAGSNTLAGAAPPSPPPPSQPVVVTNTGANPVPVAGTVTVANTPATQAVSGSVAVNNLPAVQNVAGSVSVSNLPAVQSVAVANSDPAPFQVEAFGRLDTEFPSVSFQVPAGQRLLVDYVSVSISAYNGTVDPSVTISGRHNGQLARYFELLDSAPASYGTSYGTQHVVRMSFDAGSTVGLSVHRTSGVDGLVFFNVHGELIPV